MLYIETKSNDPCYNLAFEEYILTHHREGRWLMLWQNDNTVVIGRNQNAAEEINPDFIKQHGIKLVRRMTGGGAVYHDLQNLNYSFISDVGDAESLDLRHFCEPVCRALEKMGVHAQLSGRNDILVEGKKISGVAQRIYKDRILHHGTLLFKSDGDMIAGALRADPEKFSSKSAKSVRSRVGNIWDFLPEKMSIEQFWERLKAELTEDGITDVSLSEQELKEIEQLAESKYGTWDWTYGSGPAFSFKNKRRYPGGSLQISLNSEKGCISEIAFSGDYMAVTDDAEIRQALTGVRIDRQEVRNVLEAQEITPVFGGITIDNILDTMFPE